MNKMDYELIKDEAIDIISIAQDIVEEVEISLSEALEAIKIAVLKDLNID